MLTLGFFNLISNVSKVAKKIVEIFVVISNYPT